MFERKPVLIYVTPSALYIYSHSGKQDHVWQYPSTLISYGEVIDPATFRAAALDNLKTVHTQKQTILIVLSSQVVFEKAVALKDVVGHPEVENEFYLSVPFDQASILKKEVRKRGQVQWFAAQGGLVRVLLEIGRKLNWRVEAVVPVSVFGLSKVGDTLLPNQVSIIWHHPELWREYAFTASKMVAQTSTPKHVDVEDEDQQILPKKVSISQYLLLFLSLLLLGGAVVYALSVYGYVDLARILARNAGDSKQLISPVASTSPVSEFDETVVPVDALHVQIQSSGSESLELVRRSLVDIGLKDIEDGLIEEEFLVTRVHFSERVSLGVRGQVVEALNGQLEQVELVDASKSESVDIKVEVGNVK